MILETLIASAASALFPALIDGGKALVNKITGGAGAQPSNFTEYLQGQQADLDRLKTVAELDKPIGTPSQWVVDLRASSRYIAVFLILLNAMVIGGLAASGVASFSPDYLMVSLQMANSAFFFLFGDRVYTNIKGWVKSK